MAFAKSNSESLSGLGFGGLVSGKFSVNKDDQQGLFGDKFYLYSLIICFIFLISQISLLFLKINQLPPVVPFYYSKPWGDGILASKVFLWLIPVISFVYTTLNFFLGKYFFSKDKFILRTLAGLTCVLSFSAFWVIFKITSLLI